MIQPLTNTPSPIAKATPGAPAAAGVRFAPAVAPELHGITNEQFLEAVFQDLQRNERPMVLCIADVIDKDTRWGVGSSWAPGLPKSPGMARDDEANWFFTLSTYLPEVNGQYRRTKAQFHRAYGVMLDDIGTKSASRERLQACPPSYLIETSPGNYQAGYLFAEPQENLEQVNALQEALVASGLCDPGAKGPASRLGRLPRGVNGKYDPAPMCRLVEWHPERRYTIAQIEQGLQLQPPPAKHSKSARAKVSGPAGSSAGPNMGKPEAAIFEPRASENAVITAFACPRTVQTAIERGQA